MDETAWAACTDPTHLLEVVGKRASARKLRLFAVACARRLKHLLGDERGRAALELAGRFADGATTMAERQAALHALRVREARPQETHTAYPAPTSYEIAEVLRASANFG